MIARIANDPSPSIWTVQYRCVYREHWYDDSDHPNLESAAIRARDLGQSEGRRCRILAPDGSVFADTQVFAPSIW